MSSDQPSESDNPQGTETAGHGKKPPKKKFKYTRELVRIAIDAGMTQTEIAKSCRVNHQSIVSKWANGESRGTEQQLAPLLKLYGSRLSRKTSRVYLAMDDLDPRWENTPMGGALISANTAADGQSSPYGYDAVGRSTRVEDQLAAKFEFHLADRGATWEDLLDAVHVQFASEYSTKLVEVDGPVIFRYVFNRLDGRISRAGIEPIRVAVSRWLLHDGLRGSFVLVRQYRRSMTAAEKQEWGLQQKRQEAAVLGSLKSGSSGAPDFVPSMPSAWIDSADDAGRWVCRVERSMAIAELLAFVDDYVQDPLQLHTIHDQGTLPFLLRKALVERRYSVPGVDRITDYE